MAFRSTEVLALLLLQLIEQASQTAQELGPGGQQCIGRMGAGIRRERPPDQLGVLERMQRFGQCGAARLRDGRRDVLIACLASTMDRVQDRERVAPAYDSQEVLDTAVAKRGIGGSGLRAAAWREILRGRSVRQDPSLK